MIKKIWILVLLLLSAYSMSVINSNAYVDTTTNDISNLFHTWTLEENNGIYMAKSNRIKNTADSVEIALNTTFAPGQLISTDNAFLDSYQTETSRITIYSSQTSISQVDAYDLVYEAPEVTEWLFLRNHSDGWDVEIPIDTYYEVTLVLNPLITSSVRSYIMTALNNNYQYGNQMAVDITINATSTYILIDPTVASELALLPETYGSIYENTDSMANVSMYKNGYEVSFQIFYDRTYDMAYTFSSNTDMSIFDDTYEVFYYTHENQKFILLNKGTESMFTTSDWQNQAFIPYTIWNLNTNEIIHHNQINVYMYMTLGDANHIVGYFYVDDFIIDRLMQVSTVFNYRWDPLIGSKSDWIPQAVILEDTGISEGNTSWQFDAAVSSMSATAVATGILAMIPGGQPFAFGLFLIGSAITSYFTYLATDYPNALVVGDTNQIVRAQVDGTLKNEINQKYSALNEDFTSIDTNTFPLWKLDFGAYDEFGKTAEVDPNSVHVVSLTYETNGTVYTLEADKIKTNADIDDYLDPDNDSNILDPHPTVDNDLWTSLKAFWNDHIKPLFDAYPGLIAFVIVIGFITYLSILAWLGKVYKKSKRGLKVFFTPFGLVMTAIFVFFIIMLFSGVI